MGEQNDKVTEIVDKVAEQAASGNGKKVLVIAGGTLATVAVVAGAWWAFGKIKKHFEKGKEVVEPEVVEPDKDGK